MTAGRLLREARLRAGLSQADLGRRVGRPRTQIARWEQDSVDPGFATLRELLHACGFDLHSELVPYEAAEDLQLGKNVFLTPDRRVSRMLQTLGRRQRDGGG